MPVSNINCISHYAAGTTSNPEAFKLYKVDDDKLKDWAWSKSKEDVRNVTKNTRNVLLFGVPLVDILTTGIAKKGDFYTKYVSALKSSVKWTAALGAGLALTVMRNAVNKHSEKANNFDKKHPLTNFVLDAFAIVGTYAGSMFGIKKASNFVKSKYPQSVKTVKTNLEEFLNNSKLNKEVVEPFEKYMEKHPYSSKALKITTAVAAPLMMVAAYVRYRHEVNNSVKEARTNYNILKAVNENLPEKSETVED